MKKLNTKEKFQDLLSEGGHTILSTSDTKIVTKKADKYFVLIAVGAASTVCAEYETSQHTDLSILSIEPDIQGQDFHDA